MLGKHSEFCTCKKCDPAHHGMQSYRHAQPDFHKKSKGDGFDKTSWVDYDKKPRRGFFRPESIRLGAVVSLMLVAGGFAQIAMETDVRLQDYSMAYDVGPLGMIILALVVLSLPENKKTRRPKSTALIGAQFIVIVIAVAIVGLVVLESAVSSGFVG